MNKRPYSGETQPAQRIALTADDDEFFRMALVAILVKTLGFSEVIEAGSFDEAVEKLSEREAVSLALFDLRMSGTATNVRTIREFFPRTQVVVVSSSKEKSDIIGALIAGAHGYIPKIIGISELTQALRIVLQGSIYVPPFLAELGAENSDRLEPAGGPSSVPVNEDEVLLTSRQRQALELLVQGMSNKEIARALKLGEGTIKIHVAALFRNLGVTSRAEAAAVGAQLVAGTKSVGPVMGE